MQETVAGVVPEGVVDLLEAVEIDEQRRAVGAAPAGPGEHLLHPVEDQGAVGEPGERVVQRLVADALEQSCVPNRDRGLAREPAQPVGHVGVVAQALGPVDHVTDHEADRIAVDHDRDRCDRLASQLVHELRERAAIGRGVPVPHVDRHLTAADLAHRDLE